MSLMYIHVTRPYNHINIMFLFIKLVFAERVLGLHSIIVLESTFRIDITTEKSIVKLGVH